MVAALQTNSVNTRLLMTTGVASRAPLTLR